MNHSHPQMLSPVTLRLASALAIAAGALSLAGGPAQAGVLEPIAISAPAVRTVAYDSVTGAPIKQMTIRARVIFNPVILTTHSGVSLLKDDVAEAARKACVSIHPSGSDQACVRRAVETAKPQVAAAIARARSAMMS